MVRGTLFSALSVALVVVAACGGSGSSSSDKAAQDRLAAAQATAEIQNFCLLAKLKSTTKDNYNVAFITMVQAVDLLIAKHRENPALKLPVDPQHRRVPIDKAVSDSISLLKRRSCGEDGRLAAIRLEQGSSKG